MSSGGYDAINQSDSDTQINIDRDMDPAPKRNVSAKTNLIPTEAPKNKNNSVFCSGHFLFAVAYLVLIAAVVAGFAVLKQENVRLNRDVSNLQSEYRSTNLLILNNYQTLFNQFNEGRLNELQFENITRSMLDSHSNMLVRLSNGTSNADVLDRLKVTESSIASQLTSAQHEVSKRMNSTMLKMELVVATATANIQGVQSNVSAQLQKMKAGLSDTVSDLNVQVASAQSVIHDEVEAVRANIDQYVAITNEQFAAENDFVKYQLAGTFTLLGCLISLYHLTSHLRHYSKPDVQRRVMAVLWMVPIYSITSWLSLVFPSSENVFAAIRDCYEAYAIYTFIALLIAILEDGKGLSDLINKLAAHVVEEREQTAEAITQQLKTRPKEHIKPPFACCYVYHRPTTVAAAWLYQCKLMAMQFVMLKPLLTIVPLIVSLSGYDMDAVPWIVHDSINWRSPKLYILFLQNLSVGVAFWGLLSFYHGAEKDLEWCDPWPKFLCIKGVVFATFWQSLTIQLMSSLGLVDEHTGNQIQNLLICIEMLIASLAHFYIFPYQEWAEDYKKEREKGIMLRDTLALRDFVKDMRMMVTSWDTESPAHPLPRKGEEETCSDERSGLLTGFGDSSQDLEAGVNDTSSAHLPYFHLDSASTDSSPGGKRSRIKLRSAEYVLNPVHGRESEVLLREEDSVSGYCATGSGGKKALLSCGDRETIECARRSLLEKLQVLAPDQFDHKYVPPATCTEGRNRPVKPMQSNSSSSEQLSSYLSTDDLGRMVSSIDERRPLEGRAAQRERSLSYSSEESVSSKSQPFTPFDQSAKVSSSRQQQVRVGARPEEEGFEMLSKTTSPLTGEAEATDSSGWSRVERDTVPAPTTASSATGEVLQGAASPTNCSFGDETSV